MATKTAKKKGKKKPFDFTRPDKNLTDEDRRARDAQLAEGVGCRVELPAENKRRRRR